MTGIGHMSGTKKKRALTSLNGSCDPLRSLFVIFFGVIRSLSSRSFQRYQLRHNRSFDVHMISLYFFFNFFLYPLSSQITRREKNTKKEKKITMETHQSFNDDTINYLWNGVDHTSRLKISELTCLWTTREESSDHR